MCSPHDFPPYPATDAPPAPAAEAEWTPPDMMFRRLSPDEVPAFKAWARQNYSPGEPVNPLWHPIVRDECAAINAEAEEYAAVARAEARAWDPNP